MTARSFRPTGSTTAVAAALTAALLVLAGCSASPGPGGSSTGAGLPADAASPTSAAPPGGSVSSAPRMTPSPSPPATTSHSAPPGLPGGSGDRAALAAAGELTGDGRIQLRRPTDVADAPGSGTDLCGFLFGSPGEIADITELTGDLTLDPISGRHFTSVAGAQTGDAPASATVTAGPDDTDAEPAVVIACVYRSAGAPVLALQVGDGPPIDPDLPGHPIIVDSGGLHAALSYSPDHAGPGIDPDTARAWLTAAIARVAPATTGTGPRPT